MLYNAKQSYTPPLEPHEFNPRALVIDTETVGTGPQIEIIELALCDFRGEIVFDSLVRPLYNSLPRSSREQRFGRSEFAAAPAWEEVWPQVAALIDNKLLIAYNAAFDRRALAAMCSRHRQRSPERGWRCAMQLVKRVAGAEEPDAGGGVRALWGGGRQPPRRPRRVGDAPAAQEYYPTGGGALRRRPPSARSRFRPPPLPARPARAQNG